MRSRGGALHAKPDKKMGHWSKPVTWFSDVPDKTSLRKIMKHSANKKRRQRDRKMSNL